MSKEKDHLKMVDGTPDTLLSLPPLVRQIKDNSLSVLLNCIDELFTHCDDLFFDLSSRAASNSEQNLYFESMRELRVKKHGVANRFKHNVNHSFASLVTGKAQTSISTHAEPSNRDGLSLVQNDDLEQEVSISSMTTKARVNSQESIYHLTTRLDYLVHQHKVDENNNPLDPQQLCNDFAQACELFDINIKARIIIYKQFERHVISRFANIYSAANGLLIDAGVLPKITTSVGHKAGELYSNDAKENGPDNTDQEQDVTQSLRATNEALEAEAIGLAYNLLEISDLFNSIRALGVDTATLPNYKSFSANPGPVMDSHALFDTLSRLQLNAAKPSSTSNRQQIDLRKLVNKILAGKDPKQPQAVHRSDEDVINLVAMFFDFVLDDPAVPVTIQAQIGRLQIPILKVALKDETFFSNGNHPARKLVNYMAANSIGWEDSAAKDKDAFYNKILSIVQNVNKNYVDSVGVFSDELTELIAFVEKQQHKTSLVEKRTNQSLEGKARTQKAKTVVQEMLFEKLEKQQLPEIISNFLVNEWLQLLMIIHLKDGEDSPQWLDSIQLVDDLVWVCQRQLDVKSIERLEKIKPHLMQRIHEGLSKVANTEDQAKNLVAEIERTLSAVQMAGDPVPLVPLTAEQAISLGHTPGQGSKSWQNMTGMERQQAKYQALTYEFIKKAEELPIGSWVSYKDAETGGLLRCKLANRIEVSDTYVFVNRFGFKSIEKNRKDFAFDMQQGIASPLDAGHLFDRAMSNVMDQLRQAAAA